jgi:hypothetical protein
MCASGRRADKLRAEAEEEKEKLEGWQQTAQDKEYARSSDVRLTLSNTVMEAAHKALRVRAGGSSRIRLCDVNKVKDYLGCGAEVQNYDRASFTVKVNMHRDGADFTLPVECIGLNDEVAPWLKKMKIDDLPKKKPVLPGLLAGPPGVATQQLQPTPMFAGGMHAQQLMMRQQQQQQAMMMQQQMMQQQMMQQQMMMGGGWPQQQQMMMGGAGMWPQQQQMYPGAGGASPTAGAPNPMMAAAPAAATAAPNALPPGWAAQKDPASGKEYYYNTQTKQCVTAPAPRGLQHTSLPLSLSAVSICVDAAAH